MSRLLAHGLSAGTALAALLAASGARANTLPLPGNDPFYTPPANLRSLSNGAVIRERDVSLALQPQALINAGQNLGISVSNLLPGINYALKAGFNAYQVLYKSVDGSGTPVAEAATVLVPILPWFGSGTRPLVSYQLAEDSTSVNCQPSYVLRYGIFSAGGGFGSVATYESLIGLLALAKGYAVVFSDYEGPQSQWLAGLQSAHGTLDGIRAVLHYPRDGLFVGTQVGLWGYSGGGGATGWAAALQPTYAPELNVVGAAIGASSNNNLASVFNYIDNTASVGFDVLGIVGLTRSNSAVSIAPYLTPQGKALLQDAENPTKCTVSELLTFAGKGRVENYTTEPSVPLPQLPPAQQLIPPNSLVGQSIHPQVPVLSYHDTFDDIIPVSDDNQVAAQWCAAGSAVEVERFATPFPDTGLPLIHLVGEVEGALPAIAYLSDRFADKAPRQDCVTQSMWNTSSKRAYEAGQVQ